MRALQAAQLARLAGTHAYLRDRQTGALVDLQLQPNYTFTLNAANTTPRFELVFSPQRVLGTASASLSAQVAVYPNPAAQGHFVVHLGAALAAAPATLTLTDGLGRQVYTRTSTGQPDLPVEALRAGLYLVQVRGAAGTFTQKVLVQ